MIVADKGGARAVTVPLPYDPGSIPIAVVACSAPVALRKTILSLSRAEGFMVKQLYVFQDAPELFPQVTSALNRLVDLDGLLLREQWYTHDHDRRPGPKGSAGSLEKHELIARHYRYVLSTMFGSSGGGADHVIIVEEDLVVSRDFLRFFESVAAPLLDMDNGATLLAASGWNDHGFRGMVLPPHFIDTTSTLEASTHVSIDALGVHRADHFPGLGWLCPRRLWTHELEGAWPDFVWDAWMRTPEVTKGRHTLVPEIPRSHHIGRRGSSMHLVDFEKWFPPMEIFSGNTVGGLVDRRLSSGFDDPEVRQRLFHCLLRPSDYSAPLKKELAEATPLLAQGGAGFWALHEAAVDTARNYVTQRGMGGLVVRGDTFSLRYRSVSNRQGEQSQGAWRQLAEFLGLWPPIPLDSLPLRGLSFSGVTRLRWSIQINLTALESATTAADRGSHLSAKIITPGEASASTFMGSALSSTMTVLQTLLLVSDTSSLVAPRRAYTQKHGATRDLWDDADLDLPLPPPPRQLYPSNIPYLRKRVAGVNQSCAQVCAARGLWCGPDFLPETDDTSAVQRISARDVIAAVDNCPSMVEAFGSRCVGGCTGVEDAPLTPADHKLPGLFQNPSTGATTCLISHRDEEVDEEGNEDGSEAELDDEITSVRGDGKHFANWKPSFSCARSSPHMERLCPCIVVDEAALPRVARLGRSPNTGAWERRPQEGPATTFSYYPSPIPVQSGGGCGELGSEYASPSAFPSTYATPDASILLPDISSS